MNLNLDDTQANLSHLIALPSRIMMATNNANIIFDMDCPSLSLARELFLMQGLYSIK